MKRYEIDSWGPTQLSALQAFFKQAQPGDEVVFDRQLAENNGNSGEMLDDKGCNGWVYHVANQALHGLPHERIVEVSQSVSLRTDYLQEAYPEKINPDDAPPLENAPEESLLPEEDTAYEGGGSTGQDKEEADWAAAKDAYHNRQP